MTISRNAAVNGDWLLLSEPVDKPPLTFYTNALALVFFAIETDENAVLQLDPLKGEFAGRIPAVLMSILLVAVVMQLAKALTFNSQRGTYFAGLLVALSPLRIVFAPTAFTDMPMLLFGTIALWMALKGKWGWSGFWWIISMAAKPQTVFYLPLILGLLFIHLYKADTIHRVPTKLIHFLIPVFTGIFILWLWDTTRIANGAESFYLLGQSRYTATMLTSLIDYPARLSEWWGTVQYLLGHGVVTGIASIFLLINTVTQAKNKQGLLLLLWLSLFCIIHIVLTLNLFDRNQIIILPIVAVLLSQDILHKQLTTIFLIAMSFFAIQAALWQLPIGGDDGRHDGIHHLADYLNEQPVATVIYDTWLDWELDYYMGQWTDKRRVFYPRHELLVRDALKLDETGARYFVAPTSIDISTWLLALEDANFTVNLDYELDNFMVYELLPPN